MRLRRHRPPSDRPLTSCIFYFNLNSALNWRATRLSFPIFFFPDFTFFRHRPNLQLQLYACVLGVQHPRTSDIRPAQAG